MNVKLIVALAVCLVGCATAHRHHKRSLTGESTACHAVRSTPINATCTITAPAGTALKGTLSLTQADEYSPIQITGTLTGLSPAGDHGFHVHETADFSNGCESALAHYNPLMKHHGAPTDDDRHVGDWGNIQADASGTASVSIQDKVASLFGQYSILGRSIVVHVGTDDLGKGNFPDSKTTGHAGARAGCCVIGYGHSA